jgi:serine/threonine protein kinase
MTAHRDFKLSNIFIHFTSLLDQEEINLAAGDEEKLMKVEFIVKIGDLGFSKVMADEDLQSYCGTPLNMAPEILR